MSLSLKIEVALAAVVLTAAGPHAFAAGTLGKSGSGTAVVNNIRVTGSVSVGGGVLRVRPDSTAAGTSFIPGDIADISALY